MKRAPFIGACVGAAIAFGLTAYATAPGHPCDKLHGEFEAVADLLKAGDRGSDRLWAAVARRDKLLALCFGVRP